MKLEEKMYAKEAEINQMQAMSQVSLPIMASGFMSSSIADYQVKGS